MSKSTKTASAKKSSAKSVSKSVVKKSAKVVSKKNGNGKKDGNGKKVLKPLQAKLISLFTRKEGATMHDTFHAGYQFPAMQALKMAERHGYKVNVKKQAGELTRYFAKL